MSKFSITLPHDRRGIVRRGMIIKKHLFERLFSRRSSDPDEVRKGYLIQLDPPDGSVKEYKFFRTKRGEWFLDPDCKVPLGTDEMALTIKRAIEQYESQV